MKVDIKKLSDEELAVKIRNLQAEREKTAIALKNYLDEFKLRQAKASKASEEKVAKEAAPKSKCECGCKCKPMKNYDELDAFLDELTNLAELLGNAKTHHRYQIFFK